MKTYDMTVNGQDYRLRIDMKALEKLENKLNGNMLQIVLTAVDSMKYRIEVLRSALNWTHPSETNNNPVKDAYAFSELLIDDGCTGAEDWARLLLGIALNSGVITSEQMESVADAVSENIRKAFESMRSGGTLEETPIQAVETTVETA